MIELPYKLSNIVPVCDKLTFDTCKLLCQININGLGCCFTHLTTQAEHFHETYHGNTHYI